MLNTVIIVVSMLLSTVDPIMPWVELTNQTLCYFLAPMEKFKYTNATVLKCIAIQ